MWQPLDLDNDGTRFESQWKRKHPLCCSLQRGHQSVSRICKLIIAGIFVFLLISLILAISSVLKWLDFLYFCSYVKLFITLIKYVPQVNNQLLLTASFLAKNVLIRFFKAQLLRELSTQPFNINRTLLYRFAHFRFFDPDVDHPIFSQSLK